MRSGVLGKDVREILEVFPEYVPIILVLFRILPTIVLSTVYLETSVGDIEKFAFISFIFSSFESNVSFLRMSWIL